MSRGPKDVFDRVDTDGAIADGVPAELPWLAEGARLYDNRGGPIGVESGRRRLRLLEKADRSLPINLPWCGLFVAHCMRTALPDHPLPLMRIRARPWLSFGREAEPQLGAVLVFWLRWPNSPFGHVGFYWGEDDAAFHVLGGNQRQSILIERFPKERLIGCRWPLGRAEIGRRRMRQADAATPFEHG